MVAIALPLLPALGVGAEAFTAAAAAYLAQGYYNFRRGDGGIVGGAINTGEATLTEKVADYLAGARIPVGYPPLPPYFDPALLTPLSKEVLDRLGQLANDAGTAFWELFNSTKKQPRLYDDLYAGGVSGTVPPAGNTTPATLTITRGAGSSSFFNTSSCSTSSSSSVGAATFTVTNVIEATPFFTSGTCGIRDQGVNYKLSSGATGSRSIGSTTHGYKSYPSFTFSWAGAGAEQWLPPTTGDAPFAERPEAEAATDPSGVPIAPGSAGLLDGAGTASGVGVPIPAPTPAYTPSGPVTVPATLPIQVPGAPGTQPSGTPLGTQTGTVPQPAPLPVATTPPTSVKIGDKIIDGGTASPNPTTTAQELLRIEKKLESIMDPTPDTGTELWNLLRQLVEALLAASDVGAYSLMPPCEADQESYPDGIEYPYGGSLFALMNTNSRIDAIAQMLQTSKDWRQPLCSVKPQGQPVQVQFVQSELAWEPPP